MVVPEVSGYKEDEATRIRTALIDGGKEMSNVWGLRAADDHLIFFWFNHHRISFFGLIIMHLFFLV